MTADEGGTKSLVINCQSCRYFREHDRTIGACHRFPPQFAGDMPREAHRWRFPLVMQHAWCGEFHPRPLVADGG
jgi:hypothetical protein